MIYLIPYFGAIFSSLIYFINQKKLSNFLIYLVVVLLILIAGLRYDTGFDYWNYETMYNEAKVNSIFNIKGCEPLFGAILKLFSNLNFEFCIFSIALVAIGLKFIASIKYSVIPSISILVYIAKLFVIADMGQIRQGLAMGFLLFSISYILKKDFIKFVLMVIIASFIHSSAILFLIGYLCVYIKFNKKTYLLILVLSLFFVFFDITIILSKLVKFLPNFLQLKYIFYTQVMKSYKYDYFKTVLLKLPVFFISMLYLDKIRKNSLHLLFFNLYYIGIIVSIVFVNFYLICVRGSQYFGQFEILLIPLFLYYLKPRFINVVAYFFVFIYTTFTFSKIYYSDMSKYLIPYISIFEKEKDLQKRSKSEFV